MRCTTKITKKIDNLENSDKFRVFSADMHLLEQITEDAVITFVEVCIFVCFGM